MSSSSSSIILINKNKKNFARARSTHATLKKEIKKGRKNNGNMYRLEVCNAQVRASKLI